MSARSGLAATALALGLLAPRAASADDPVTATFALIIGSNGSVDPDLKPLRYADDDAAEYLDLFRMLGARTYLLSRLDDNTRRLHPQAAAEALEPRRANLERAFAQLAADVARAKERQVETALYFVFAGHGSVQDGEGYVTIEDMRITGADLARMLADVPATRVHVIVDACGSYYLAYGRGPGGERRPLTGFQDSAQLANDPRVGLLLSTSSDNQSHEWDGFQAGVFSHEVRSGLYGGADADGDGRVSYREIAAFVSRANAAIPNDRFRPDVHARPPRTSDTLLDLRHGLGRRLEIDGSHAGHYAIEDARGVRLADVHNAPGQAVRLVRPAPNGPVYVRRVDDDTEFTVPSAPDVIALVDLDPAKPRAVARGAANEAYRLLFSLPFDRAIVDTYGTRPLDTEAPPVTSEGIERDAVSTRGLGWPLRRVLGWTGVGLGVLGIGAGAFATASAMREASDVSRADSELSVSERNARIGTWNAGAMAGYLGGGALLAAGGALLLWHSKPPVQALVVPSGASLFYAGDF